MVAPVVITVAASLLSGCGGAKEELHANPPPDEAIIANPPGPDATVADPVSSAAPDAALEPPRNPPGPNATP